MHEDARGVLSLLDVLLFQFGDIIALLRGLFGTPRMHGDARGVWSLLAVLLFPFGVIMAYQEVKS
jgi:hypothetical protein